MIFQYILHLKFAETYQEADIFEISSQIFKGVTNMTVKFPSATVLKTFVQMEFSLNLTVNSWNQKNH